jgi:DNA mismatch repair protein MutS2
MIYPENFEQKIGFDKIRQLITARCLSPLGEEKVREMFFSSEYLTIKKQLYQTHEFTQIIQEEDQFPSDYFFDVRGSLRKIRVEGTYLTDIELFNIRRSLETINEIIHFFHRKQENITVKKSFREIENHYPHLQELTTNVSSFPHLTRQIDTILDKFGKIKENASPELANIRRQLSQTTKSISNALQTILRTAQSEGWVDKEVSPTLRDGRLVIPISPVYKRKLKGIVHDESATGKTVFIEPAEIVEINNRIRELESEERREIVRILTVFTNQIRPEISEILNAYKFLAEIDFIRAKALFALDINAILPVFEDVQQIKWIHAIHPLLYISHKKQNKPVIPLDIELIHTARILVISGPNAGGKSVLLKTVGLLQYMLQSGLLIPVGERSETGIFKDIFLDIGDEQSIENDLSTYSSHLTNMKFMVKNVNFQSLILIDEFGGGTEPRIGGAIAEALLHRFNNKKSFGVITTHYQNLKIFAEDHPGVINGAMLYDRHQMQPLFQLSIGNPGSSFAIEIAKKIGLPEDVIAEASEKVGQDYIHSDKYLQDIVRDKRYWESKRQHIRLQEKRLDELTEQYKADLEKLNSQRKEIIIKAKTDAEHLLSKTNAKIEKTIREIKESQAEKEKTKEVRKSLDEFKKSIQKEETDDIIVRKINKIKAKENRKKTEFEQAFNPKIIEIGDSVRIIGQQTVGELIEKKQKNVVIAFGAIKTTVNADLIEKVSNSRLKKEAAGIRVLASNSSDSLSEKKLQFKPEIDIRGMRGEEALLAVTYYIDDAIQCNAGRIRILHGTGSGTLRQIIRDYLKTTAGIKHFQDEHVQFGGTGITIVELE